MMQVSPVAWNFEEGLDEFISMSMSEHGLSGSSGFEVQWESEDFWLRISKFSSMFVWIFRFSFRGRI